MRLVINIQDLILIVLLFGFVFLIFEIKKLRGSLKKEESRKLMPLLILEIAPEGNALVLHNQSSCPAKDIEFEDVSLTIDVGFKKKLILKFDPVRMIGPDQRVQLSYKAFDGSQELGPPRSEGLFVHIQSSQLEIKIHYKNLENLPFQTVLTKDGDVFSVKEIQSEESDENNRPNKSTGN